MRFVAEAAAVGANAARDGPEHVRARSLKAGFVVGACVGACHSTPDILDR